MIIVSVQLHSAIDGSKTELARMHITNAGGTDTVRDYEVRTLRGRSTAALNGAQTQRKGRVLGHRSLDQHVWNLVGKALAGMGYGKPAEVAAEVEIVRLTNLLRTIAFQSDAAWAQQIARAEVDDIAPPAADGEAAQADSPLQALIDFAKARWKAMTPAEQEAELLAQRESWARGEKAIGNDRVEAAERADLRGRS